MINKRNNVLEHLPYVVTWESELEQMCGQADDFGNIETGGECYGLFSHGGRPVIMFVTPSGPNAVHQIAHFRQDIPFFKRVDIYLAEKFGLNFLATHHSHHRLKIYGLSSGDIRSTHAIATKNGIHRMCQILLTFAETDNLLPESAEENVQNNVRRYRDINDIHGGWGFHFFEKRLNNAFIRRNHLKNKIRIHAYIYNDAQNGQPIRCPLKAIPGLSPIRRLIKYNTPIPELRRHYQFPLTDMLYDDIDSRINRIETNKNLPSKIMDAIHTLPENILEKLQFRIIDDLLFIRLPIKHDRMSLSVVHKTTPPYSVKMISILSDGKHTDVTNQIISINEKISLPALYQRCKRFNRLSHQNVEKSYSDEPNQLVNRTIRSKKFRADGKKHIGRNIDEAKLF